MRRRVTEKIMVMAAVVEETMLVVAKTKSDVISTKFI